MTSRVLIVDDESNIRRMLKALLEQESYEVHDIGGGADAPGVVAAFEPDVVLLDLVMPPGPDGIATLEILRARYPDRVVIMMSGKATLTDAVRATKLGAFQFREKPLTPEGVLVAVKAAIDLSRTRAENRELRAALGTEQTIIGDSPAIEAVRSLIAQVAPTPARVLITGESGTGKELVARAVHDESARASKPLISLNCAAIPNGLIESEMSACKHRRSCCACWKPESSSVWAERNQSRQTCESLPLQTRTSHRRQPVVRCERICSIA